MMTESAQAGGTAPVSGEALRRLVEGHLRDIPDFPKPGVVFKDFTPLLRTPEAMAAVVDDTARRRRGSVDLVVGIEARGFILGAAIAYALGVGFVPVRKAGKLPGDLVRAAYSLEYGSAEIEMHRDAVTAGQRCLVVDDVLATGGTVEACCGLIEECGGIVQAVEIVLELPFLHGRQRLADYEIHSILTS